MLVREHTQKQHEATVSTNHIAHAAVLTEYPTVLVDLFKLGLLFNALPHIQNPHPLWRHSNNTCATLLKLHLPKLAKSTSLFHVHVHTVCSLR